MTITWQQVLQVLFGDGKTITVTSLLYLAFFAVVAVLHYALPRMARPYFLLAASYLFFCYEPANRPLVWVLLLATVVTWGCGLGIGKTRHKPLRIALLLAAILTAVGLLLYYKYWNLFADVTGGLIPRHEKLLAPLGLSYFVFAALSYTLDVYLRRCKVETNLFHYALFVSFFPTLITGPIERYPQLRPQIQKSRRFSYNRCAGGAFRMLWGYTKKMVVADNLYKYVSFVYGDVSQMDGPNLAAATVLFAVQLYMDFSGCCDIALGAARILGYDLIENFRSPFTSRSFGEFWNRWHISMTGWFRDYIYFPLGGSRCALWRCLLNTVIVFTVSGLWHGADWRYLMWGIFCGVLVALGRLTKELRQNIAAKNPLYRFELVKAICQIVIVNFLFCVTLVFFASAYYNADPYAVYAGLFHGWAGASVSAALAANGLEGYLLWTVAALCVLVFGIEYGGRNVAKWIRKRFILLRWVLYYLLAAAILFCAAFGQSPFIYQQF